MKKILAIVVLFCLLSALAACGADSKEKNDDRISSKKTDIDNPVNDIDENDDVTDDIPDVLTEDFVRNYPETPASNFEYLKNEDYVVIERYLGTDSIVVIPEQIDGLPVTELNMWLFTNNTPVRAVMIPDAVETLNNLFINNETVELVICDSVKNVEYMTFGNCSSLHTVIFGESLQSIGGGVFFACDSLETLYIPSSVTQIHETAFLGAAPSLTLQGEAGSYIETYATAQGIPFQAK